MKDISIYFSPVSLEGEFSEFTIGGTIVRHSEGNFPEIEKGGVALIYVPEFRGDKNFSSQQSSASDAFRSSFYELFRGIDWTMPVYDLGDILPGNELNDTYFAVGQVVAELVKKKVLPLVIGGSQDLTLALYKGYEKLEQTINLCCVDHKLDLGDPDSETNSDGFISQLLLQRPCYLFNHANIGLQAPFASKAEFELFEKLYFDICRLGEFNADFRKAEPHLRNSDILSIDFKSIRASELLNVNYTSPNGFYADQICQISKYAGISDKLTSFGVFNFIPEKKPGAASALLAQIIWYFIDGFAQRKGDFPVGSKKDYLKFTVHLDDFKDEVIFYKSNKSERWWMEVPYPPQAGSKYERHHLVPCDMQDYEQAMKNEIPNLWWKTYQKLG
jgi:arginase family enzyme